MIPNIMNSMFLETINSSCLKNIEIKFTDENGNSDEFEMFIPIMKYFEYGHSDPSKIKRGVVINTGFCNYMTDNLPLTKSDKYLSFILRKEIGHIELDHYNENKPRKEFVEEQLEADIYALKSIKLSDGEFHDIYRIVNEYYRSCKIPRTLGLHGKSVVVKKLKEQGYLA